MLTDGEFRLHENEVITNTWNRVLIDWINICIKPDKSITELAPHCFGEVLKCYHNDLFEEIVDETDSSDVIVPFLKRHYPKLVERYQIEGTQQAKSLITIMTAFLFYCCVHDNEGSISSDITKNLDKSKIKMIVRVYQFLKRMEITFANIESAIKDAYVNTYGNTDNKRTNKLEDNTLLIRDKEITGTNTFKGRFEPRKFAVTRSSTSVSLKAQTDWTRTCSTSSLKPTVFKENLVFEPYVSQRELKIVEPMESEESFFRKRQDFYYYQDDGSQEYLEMDVRDDSINPCQKNCECTKCTSIGPSCGDPGNSMEGCDRGTFGRSKSSFVVERSCKVKLYCALAAMVLLAVLVVLLCSISTWNWNEQADIETRRQVPKSKRLVKERRGKDDKNTSLPEFYSGVFESETEGLLITNKPLFRSAGVDWQWQCVNHFCLRAHTTSNVTIYSSLSRCTLLCMGPQLWPYPIGYKNYSSTIVALTTTNLEYKFQSVPSETVHSYLAEAFKIFLKGLFRLEKADKDKRNESIPIDLPVKRISFHIEVEHDPDPKLRLNTDEAYMLSFETIDEKVVIKVISGSFCGVRHGLETVSQLILLDQDTGYLISLSGATIKDAPSYRYRGLMLDTGANYIPVSDIARTLDAMAACKLNTLHWRISSETSFPLYLNKLPMLAEYGAYDRSMIYTRENVKNIVRKAGLRGIRILIEVTAPGPVGRAWSWFSGTTCPMKTDNYTCDNVLCTRLLMEQSVFDTLQILYTEILHMTGVNDVFHLSDGTFSMINCYQLISDRDGFLDKALERLKIANNGFLPKLPIIWYTTHLMKDSEARAWERLGVQLNKWDPNPGDQYLGKFRVIHSTKWDLSCEMSKHRCVRFKTWQEMYAWKTWRNVEVFTVEGGEATLWTDLIGSGNLDTTIWPRAAAVAERLWSDMSTNSTANKHVYVRLDTHRWRMLLRGIKVQPIWPAWCSFNPNECLEKIRT